MLFTIRTNVAFKEIRHRTSQKICVHIHRANPLPFKGRAGVGMVFFGGVIETHPPPFDKQVDKWVDVPLEGGGT
ncbi:MAG: hypothetical protein EAZ24_12300 [Burkholderiales bacterium]|nr:MAG: hypothetical protein EAZ24_12300 [Burkholderiales bacterium]TAG84774.1 MAG: hypothetical protein EAZ21_00025 [Betaproteobacteria bacterium]